MYTNDETVGVIILNMQNNCMRLTYDCMCFKTETSRERRCWKAPIGPSSIGTYMCQLLTTALRESEVGAYVRKHPFMTKSQNKFTLTWCNTHNDPFNSILFAQCVIKQYYINYKIDINSVLPAAIHQTCFNKTSHYICIITSVCTQFS